MGTVSAPINTNLTHDQLKVKYNDIISFLSPNNIDGVPTMINNLNNIMTDLYKILIKYTMQLNSDDIENFLNIVPQSEQNKNYNETKTTLKDHYTLLLNNYNDLIKKIENSIGRSINGITDGLQKDGKTPASAVEFYNTLLSLTKDLKEIGIDSNNSKIKNLTNISEIMKQIKMNNDKINKNSQINDNKNQDYKLVTSTLIFKSVVFIILILLLLFLIKKIISSSG
jgi:hypothetical protein